MLPTVVHTVRRLRALWESCAGCGVLFPAGPGQTRCPACTSLGWWS